MQGSNEWGAVVAAEVPTMEYVSKCAVAMVAMDLLTMEYVSKCAVAMGCNGSSRFSDNGICIKQVDVLQWKLQ